MGTTTKTDVHAGLEGVIVAETRLSEVDGDLGRLIVGGHDIEHLGGEAPGDAHFFLLFRGLDGHMHRFSVSLPVGARKALFRLDRHAIKRGLFWQRNPTRAS